MEGLFLTIRGVKGISLLRRKPSVDFKEISTQHDRCTAERAFILVNLKAVQAKGQPTDAHQ